MTWNYRIICFDETEDDDGVLDPYYAICEVFYDRKGKPLYYCTTPAAVLWEPDDGPGTEAAMRILQRMQDALAKPIINESDFKKDK